MLERSAIVGFVGVGVAVAVAATGCSADRADATARHEDRVTVDTSTPSARAQYDANVAFASAYAARCNKPATDLPRVLVTGFGRFMDVANNATGRIVSTLVPAARYPETTAPPIGAVDPPEPQLSVGQATLELPLSGKVEVCAMVLPVYWDLAAILVAKELDAFEPSFVMLNGVADTRQDLWLELGATNRAEALDDGSDRIHAYAPDGPEYAILVDGGEDARPNMLSWDAVHAAASAAVDRHANDVENGARFGDILPGVKRAGFPRKTNTYLCNDLTYVTGWLMSHPRTTTTLLRASVREAGKINELDVKVSADLSLVPRVFVHWPGDLADRHRVAGALVMEAVLDAQLASLAIGDAPTPGVDATADPTLKGAGTF